MTADVTMKTILIHKKPLLLNKRGFQTVDKALLLQGFAIVGAAFLI